MTGIVKSFLFPDLQHISPIQAIVMIFGIVFIIFTLSWLLHKVAGLLWYLLYGNLFLEDRVAVATYVKGEMTPIQYCRDLYRDNLWISVPEYIPFTNNYEAMLYFQGRNYYVPITVRQFQNINSGETVTLTYRLTRLSKRVLPRNIYHGRGGI